MIPAAGFLILLLGTGYWLLVDRPTLARLGAYAVLLIGAACMLASASGTPRPWLLQMRPVEGEVAGYSLDEGRAVYLWIKPDDGVVPLALALPWSQRTAAQLEQGKAASQHTGRKMRALVRGNGMLGEAHRDGVAGGKRITAGDGLSGAADPVEVSLAPAAPVRGKDAPDGR